MEDVEGASAVLCQG